MAQFYRYSPNIWGSLLSQNLGWEGPREVSSPTPCSEQDEAPDSPSMAPSRIELPTLGLAGQCSEHRAPPPPPHRALSRLLLPPTRCPGFSHSLSGQPRPGPQGRWNRLCSGGAESRGGIETTATPPPPFQHLCLFASPASGCCSRGGPVSREHIGRSWGRPPGTGRDLVL